MKKLFDALFDLCLSRQQREKHRRNREKGSKENSPVSSKSSSPASSRASSPPRRSQVPPPSPASPTVRSRDTSPYRVSGSPNHPYAMMPRVIHPRQARVPICYDDIVERQQQQKEAKRKSLEIPTPPPLVYPLPPMVPLQGVGKYRRSIHVSETFIENNRRDAFKAHELDPFLIPPFKGKNGIQLSRDVDLPSSDSTGAPESMTSAETSSPVSTCMTVSSGAVDTAKRIRPIRRASEGNMDTTSPPTAFNESCEEATTIQDSLKTCEGEIVERDGKLVILVHNNLASPSPPRPSKRGYRLPPIPDNQEFESDTESEDGGVAIVEGVEEVESFTSHAAFQEQGQMRTTRTSFQTTRTTQVHRRRIRPRRQATHPGAFFAQAGQRKAECQIEQRCAPVVRRIPTVKRKVRAEQGEWMERS